VDDWLKEIEESNMFIFVRIKQCHILEASQVDVLTSEIKLLTGKENFTNKLKLIPCGMEHVK